MSRRSATLLPLILALAACAEGGGRGSGISTAVLGNVQAVLTDAQARTGVDGIHVWIDGAGPHTRTDPNGDFVLHGPFDGMVTLVFRLPDAGGEARVDLNVPAAGTLTLNNVTIDTQRQAAYAETQDIDFDAVITVIDCPGQLLTLASAQEGAQDSDRYTLRLDTSVVRDQDGNTVDCAALRDGERGKVWGMVCPDGSFGNATFDLED